MSRHGRSALKRLMVELSMMAVVSWIAQKLQGDGQVGWFFKRIPVLRQ